jgi:hypothetical protein
MLACRGGVDLSLEEVNGSAQFVGSASALPIAEHCSPFSPLETLARLKIIVDIHPRQISAVTSSE